MERDRGVAVTDGQVIKLEHVEGEDLQSITQEEKGIVNVRETYARLVLQVEEIEKRITERQEKVEAALREKKRDQALSYLRSRKMLEELLVTRTKSMETLHGILIKIEQAASDVEIVKAYEMSTSALKSLLSNEKLQPEHIESSMDQMQETLADADEVRRAVEVGNEGIRRTAGEEELDDEEMEAELRKLRDENDREQEERERARKKADLLALDAPRTIEETEKASPDLPRQSEPEAIPSH
jgi:charged multivesicular body protein 7